MADSRPRASQATAGDSDVPWGWILAGVGVGVAALGAYALMNSESPKKAAPATKAKAGKAAAAAAASTPVAASTDAADPTPVAEPAAAPTTEEVVGASADSSAVVPIPEEDDIIIEAGDAVVEYDADGAVTKDSLVMLLRHLTEKVQERRVALKAAVEAGEMPESEFERGLGQAIPEIENTVNERFAVDAESVFKAQTKHQEDPAVVEVSRELRNAALPDFAAKAMGEMEDMIGGQGAVPEGMTAARVAEMTTENATATIAKMKELVAEVRADGLTGQEALQAFQTRFIERAKRFTMETFESIGVSPDDYAACMMKFVESSEVQMAQAHTQQRLMLCQQLNMMELSSGMSREDAISSLGIPAEIAEAL